MPTLSACGQRPSVRSWAGRDLNQDLTHLWPSNKVTPLILSSELENSKGGIEFIKNSRGDGLVIHIDRFHGSFYLVSFAY
ncbi:hypothetical protein Desde_3964 [Desulfitobacterium dehalogenans ATCC 51507]|uniref:Uncharacterized protein n=1 Tax=Desulfitobacterium dehalogenans (strain ATCC 51507 / DSM 9161 / JW/IU-DC1) TaxID=756499 RepID=I4AE45_DESDJ|nr:hypothetical protein Desde_3964 [Desulfitobacterium dehalogenans ATCC 51507]